MALQGILFDTTTKSTYLHCVAPIVYYIVCLHAEADDFRVVGPVPEPLVERIIFALPVPTVLLELLEVAVHTTIELHTHTHTHTHTHSHGDG